MSLYPLMEFLVSDLGIFIVYAVPFGLAALMPGFRALAVTGVALGGLILFAFLRLSAEEVPGGVSLGQAMVLGLLLWSAFGYFSGVITRTIDLARSPGPLAARVGVYLVGFALLPGLFLAWSWWRA